VTRLRRIVVSVLGALIAAALALGMGLLVGPDSSAGAAPTPEFSLSFDGLTPGVPMTESATFTLDRDATLTSFAWLEQQGLFINPALLVVIEVCDSTGSCVDPTNLGAGVPFAAGTATVRVTVEMVTPVGNGATGSVVGQLVFVAEDELPLTGLGSAPWLAAGAAAVAVGVLIMVALGRRRPS
jgi:hypothetical protein